MGKSPIKLTDFEARGKQIRRTAKDARKLELANTALRPRERADNAFRLSAYQYYRELKNAGHLDRLRAYVEERDGSQWKGHGESDELWVLRLATRDEQTDSKRKKRSRLAAELRLADVNDVRPELLLGFLYEAGPSDLIERDAKHQVRYDWADAYRSTPRPKGVREARPNRKAASEDEVIRDWNEMKYGKSYGMP